MSIVFLATFLTIATLLLIRGVRRPGRMYEYSFLAAAVFLGWVGPQAVGLLGDPTLPNGGFSLTLLMATLCVAAVYLGHRLRPLSLRWLDWGFNERWLLWVAGGLSAVGAIFAWEIRGLPNELLVGTWKGLPVIYGFFADLQYYGFAISALLFARTGSKISLSIGFFDFAFFLYPLVIGARRGIIIEVGLIVLLAAWFGRRRALPRPGMMAVLLLATLFVFSVGQYRSVVYQRGGYGGHNWGIPSADEILTIDYWGNFHKVLNGGAYELRNAVYDIAATEQTFSFNFGTEYWNSLVQDYVPRQIVGGERKASLMFDVPDAARETYGYVPHPGTTHTGFSDSFRAFGLLGALAFLLIGWFMSSLYAAALKNHFIAQLLYMVLITDALLAITHGTARFLAALPHAGIFLVGGCLLARRRARDTARRPTMLPEPERL